MHLVYRADHRYLPELTCWIENRSVKGSKKKELSEGTPRENSACYCS